jgi:chorismate dehydratase
MISIGRIPYINLFPIFYYLEKNSEGEYRFVDGVPSVLNKLLRSGQLDLSPSSSIEYLRYAERYTLIPGHSISARGPVRSIILFSRVPIEELNGETILYLYHSETSIALLRIILERFHNIRARYRSSSASLTEGLQASPAYLLIGDRAMIELRNNPAPYVYDLGEIWYQKTALPFVFALWIAGRKGKDSLIERIKNDLDRALNLALNSFETLAATTPASEVFSQRELVDYWKGISYTLEDDHLRGLDLFRRYCLELGIIEGN